MLPASALPSGTNIILDLQEEHYDSDPEDIIMMMLILSYNAFLKSNIIARI